MPPKIPARLVPMNVAMFMEIAPGVLSAMAKTSSSSSCVSHLCLSTTSCSIMESMAYPPPKENSPILKNTANILRLSLSAVRNFCFIPRNYITKRGKYKVLEPKRRKTRPQRLIPSLFDDRRRRGRGSRRKLLRHGKSVAENGKRAGVRSFRHIYGRCLLLFGNRSDGASVFASAAIDALGCIHDKLAVAFGNGSDGAGVRASAAGNAFVTDNSCHLGSPFDCISLIGRLNCNTGDGGAQEEKPPKLKVRLPEPHARNGLRQTAGGAQTDVERRGESGRKQGGGKSANGRAGGKRAGVGDERRAKGCGAGRSALGVACRRETKARRGAARKIGL